MSFKTGELNYTVLVGISSQYDLILQALLPAKQPTDILSIIVGHMDLYRYIKWRAGLTVSLSIILSGCTVLQESTQAPGVTVDSTCIRLFETVDRVVDMAGTRDGQATRIAGFHFHRINRFLASFRNLRSVALPTGEHRSMFRPDGLVAGTERMERWVLWPMGIPAPGSMRQWGHHATAFAGKRHFDDPDLVYRYFKSTGK